MGLYGWHFCTHIPVVTSRGGGKRRGVVCTAMLAWTTMPTQLIMINTKMSIAKISTNTNGNGHSCHHHRCAHVGAGAGGSCSCCCRHHCYASDGAVSSLYVATVIHLVVHVMLLWHWPSASPHHHCHCRVAMALAICIVLPWTCRRRHLTMALAMGVMLLLSLSCCR